MKLCAVVLCGGKSSRMGTNKSLLKINDQPVIDRIIEELRSITDNIIIIANEKDHYKYLDVPIFQDRYKDAGPLAGIESALYHIEADSYLFTACDMPFIRSDIYEYLLKYSENYDAVVPMHEERVHPLASIYSHRVLPVIQEKIANNDLRVRSFFADIEIKYIETYPNISEQAIHKHFFNMNNPSQYEQAKGMAK